MSGSTKKKGAAWSFLGCHGSPEGQSATAREMAAIPGLRTAAQRAYLTEPKHAEIKQVVLDFLESGSCFPNATRTNEVLALINPTINQVLNGEITARSAGEKLRKDVDAILK